MDIANWFRYHEDVANWAMWAIFILCYDQLQNKIQFVRLAGITTILGLLEYNQSSLEVNRHCIAILYDLLREGNKAEGKQYDPWTLRRQALAAGLHNRVVKAMSEFSDSMDIMMMRQEMLIGTLKFVFEAKRFTQFIKFVLFSLDDYYFAVITAQLYCLHNAGIF